MVTLTFTLSFSIAVPVTLPNCPFGFLVFNLQSWILLPTQCTIVVLDLPRLDFVDVDTVPVEPFFTVVAGYHKTGRISAPTNAVHFTFLEDRGYLGLPFREIKLLGDVFLRARHFYVWPSRRAVLVYIFSESSSN
jgi:hypothetical protein